MKTSSRLYWGICLILFPSVLISEPTNLNVSTNSHYITRDGEPIILLGDTVWPIHIKMSDDEIKSYLDDAKNNGFNLIGVFLMPVWAMKGDHAWNRENIFGEKAFNNSNVTELNPKFWGRLVFVIEQAKARDMYVMICAGELMEPVDGYPVHSISQAYDFGRLVGDYFKNVNSHIIWTPSQDSRYPGNQLPVKCIEALAEGITDGIIGEHENNQISQWENSFFTWHGGLRRGCEIDPIKDSEWLDVYAYETYLYYHTIVPVGQDLWAKRPQKPVFLNEPAYEDTSESITAWHARFQAYWAFFSGCCAYVYGGKDLWDMKCEDAGDWKAALKHEGRLDMQWLAKLINSKPITDRIPDQSLITSLQKAPDYDFNYICATRADDGSWAFIYSTKGEPFSVNTSVLAGDKIRAKWYNPRSGNYDQDLGILGQSNNQDFDPPGMPREGNDWVLVLETVDLFE